MTLAAIENRLAALSEKSSPWDGEMVYLSGAELDLWHNCEGDLEALVAVAKAAKKCLPLPTMGKGDAWVSAMRELGQAMKELEAV